MPRRLKVYFARLGFFETVVAAANQADALAAWGVRQDLFAAGDATVFSDPAGQAALEHPGEPLKRAVGAKGAFSLDPAPPRAPAKPGKLARTAAPNRKPDRSALAAAERRAERVASEEAEEKAEFQRRREALDSEEKTARKRWAETARAAQQHLRRERGAYAKAGGH